MGEGREFFAPAAPGAPVGPPPPPVQPYTARIDAAETALNEWGEAQGKKFGLTWQVSGPEREAGGR